MTQIQFNLLLKRLDKLENDLQSVLVIGLHLEARTAVLLDAVFDGKSNVKNLEIAAYSEAVSELEKLELIYSDCLKRRNRAMKKARKGNGHADV